MRGIVLAALLMALASPCRPVHATDLFASVDDVGELHVSSLPFPGARRFEPVWDSRLDAAATPFQAVSPKPEHRGSVDITPRIERAVMHAAAANGLDPALLHAVIRAESNYRQDARSRAGACGLMQLMPATARRFGVKDRFNVEQNIAGGAAYLRWLQDRFDGDLELSLAAYNAGEGAVLKYGRAIPPFRETREYIRKVMSNYRRR